MSRLRDPIGCLSSIYADTDADNVQADVYKQARRRSATAAELIFVQQTVPDADGGADADDHGGGARCR